MSSPGQATDLSMDEILASIRKIISEDPKPAAVIAPVRTPVTDGMLSAAHAARQNAPVKTALSGNIDPASVQQSAQHGARSITPALDDDILDLMDEDKAPIKAPAVAPLKGEPVTSTAEKSAQTEQPARPGLNELWAPREWAKPSAPATTAPLVQTPLVQTGSPPVPVSPLAEPTEARLEAAIAALGQSLASPQQSDLNAKAWPPAAPPKMPAQPGPRIDVVAVVNAATRAALAQRSADEQMAMPVSAVPTASVAVALEQPVTQATLAQPPSKADSVSLAPRNPVNAEPEARSISAATAAPAVAPAVNAAVEAALAAARAAPPRAEVVKTPEVPKAAPPAAVTKPVSESTPIKSAAPVAGVPALAEAPKRIIAVPVNSVPSVASAVGHGMSGNAGSLPPATALPSPAAGVQTLEDTVARLLRPMLRQWLDDNMPRIVEKAFKEELAAQAAPPPSAPRVAN